MVWNKKKMLKGTTEYRFNKINKSKNIYTQIRPNEVLAGVQREKE